MARRSLRSSMRTLRLSPLLVAFLLTGCATIQPARPAPRVPEVPAFGTWSRFSSAAARNAVAKELDCPAETVELWQNDLLVRARGCQRLVYFEKAADKTWSRTGPLFELEAEDAQVDYDAEWPSEPSTGPSEFRLTNDEWGQLIRQYGTAPTYYARADCILRVDGSLHHCLVLGSTPIVSEAMARWLKERRLLPRKRDGAAVPSAFEELVLTRIERAR